MSSDSPPAPAHDDRTIRDFGDQWTAFSDNEGYYASVELFQDVCGPLFDVEDLAGMKTADIGAGTGRNTLMLINAGAAHVVAVEPSAGVEALRANVVDVADRVEVLHVRGDELPCGRDLDLVISIGVVQFIPEPHSVLRAAHEALKPGGKLLIWVYSQEGNEVYIFFARMLRAVTKRLPHFVLSGLCGLLNLALDVYIPLCRVLPLPQRDYALNVLAKFDRPVRRVVIYDQLNPTYVKWYTREEVEELLTSCGFVDVELYHRHGYSWTALGVSA